ncbi:class I adenylate-forming enzyme family protein [Sansalvadorimonas verongulae]|uniref:class I adenylate-forming enzyme family protein n=1 Tax=Sansalvadorimonas verongulae TaxID=2172824 RepID=UPI0012BD0132|nr:class I adenylate-forming enzyme family protein [Sansalvadorimonas verongulae]MTI15297.1 hypothetical protein [Sansalvadorimonas verongulae]
MPSIFLFAYNGVLPAGNSVRTGRSMFPLGFPRMKSDDRNEFWTYVTVVNRRLCFSLALLFFCSSVQAVNWADKPWFKHYPDNIQKKLTTNPELSPPSIDIEALWGDYFATSDAATRIAVTGLQKKLTVNQLDRQSKALAVFLQRQKFPDNARVAVMMPSSPELLVTLLGVFRAGLVPVIVLTAGDHEMLTVKLGQQLQASGASMLIGMKTHSKVVDAGIDVANRLETERGGESDFSSIPLVMSGVMDADKGRGIVGGLKRLAVTTGASLQGKTQTPPRGSISLSQAINIGESGELRYFQKKPDDTAILQFTSGTTGTPKAIPISYKNLFSNHAQVVDILQHYMRDAPENPSMWMPLPMTHSFGLLVALGVTPTVKGTLHLVADPRNAKELMSTLSNSQPDMVFGVDKLLHRLATGMSESLTKVFENKKPTLVISGASATRSTTRTAVQRVFGTNITEGYGMSETTVAIALELEPGAGLVPLPYVDLVIANIPDDADISAGIDLEMYAVDDEGDVLVSGDNVCSGYYDCPDETAKTFIVDKHGRRWIKTGDKGVLKEGHLKLTGRSKEIIIVGGQNVNPESIETIANTVAGVQESMSIGIQKYTDTATADERVALIVNPHPGHEVSPEQVLKALRESRGLEAHELPVEELIHVLKPGVVLPRTPLFKLKRVPVKNQLADMIRKHSSSLKEELSVKDQAIFLRQVSLEGGK